MTTLLIVLMAYGCLFGLLRACGASLEVMIWCPAFLTAVGAAQTLLFRGRAPRVASMIGGVFVMNFLFVKVFTMDPFRPFDLGFVATMIVVATVQGAILGYLAGTLVGGVFLLAHLFRRRIGGYNR